MPTTFNTTDPKPGYVYDAASDTWFPLLGIAPASQVDRWTKTAAGGETSLSGNDDNAVSLSYTAGTEQVYLNGVLLVRGQDYTATNGTTITGLTALAASDIAEVITLNPSNIITTDAVIATDFEAKGDLISASAASTPVRLPVGTTGQVLKANSATTSGLEWGTVDADIEGVTAGTGISGGGTSGTVTITNSMATAIDAKGDLVAGTGADAFARLAVGANGTVLTAASGEATGLSWATPSVDANFTLLNSGGTSLSGGTTTVSFSAYNSLLITLENVSTNAGNSVIDVRFNSDTGSNYYVSSWYMQANGGIFQQEGMQDTRLRLLRMDLASHFTGAGSIQVWGAKTSGQKPVNFVGRGEAGGNTNGRAYVGVGRYSGSSAITSVSIISSDGNFDNGTVFIYGSN